ncbi:PD-(D/E)XK nuclease family protein [Flavobacterium sp.]|uniref:PD-(D/E)XK nuclease family protein n=1 Tax=Flavobacterium sp. TaxID=239 RepID=UPI0035AEE39D
MNTTFLGHIAQQLLEKPTHLLEQTIVVLPNKRAKLFLIEALKQQSTSTFFAPSIISIESLIETISGLRSLDAIELLFEFYSVYLQSTPEDKQQDFERFSNWAKTLLQDFNEIDRYLVDPNDIFSYLLEIERIKHWTPNKEQQTVLIEQQIEFWKQMPVYYQAFTNHLLQKKIGYSGLIYKQAVQNKHHFIKHLANQQFVFAGFNALNKAEEIIIQYLLEEQKAEVYWDIDQVFMNDDYHDAGYFLRRIKKSWKYLQQKPFNWIFDEFSKEKKIEVISTPKSIGQAKIAGKIIESIAEQTATLEQTALVLSEEKLLIPVLNALPEAVKNLNITMGYSSVNNPAQILIHKLFKLHVNAFKRNNKQGVFYYKEVLEIINNPLIEPLIQGFEMVQKIKKSNLTFITASRLKELYENSNQHKASSIFELLFQNWDVSVTDILLKLQQINLEIKASLQNDNEQDKITKAFVYSVYKVLIQIGNYQENFGRITSLEGLFTIYKQVIDQAEVSFEGEPLMGLQIMGILESRVLDFENVIITSLNEGKLPAGKSAQSFIPYDVKIEKGLPTYKERDAIFTYHFYRLLQRAKNIYLLYNNYSEGLDAGEKSRFLTQLDIEHLPQHTYKKVAYNAYLPDKAYQPIEIVKTEKILSRLKEIATDRGFSPSSLTNYLRNPIQFYYQRILGVKENEEVEENVAVNTLGTIIHEVLEKMYTPFIGATVPISVDDINQMMTQIDDFTKEKFIEIYKEGEINKGKNLIAFEVAKRNIQNFLFLEKASIEAGDELFILSLEASHETVITHENLPYPVKIAGKVDRIERRNNSVRIIDYKTGKVMANNLKINTFEGLSLDLKHDKIIQLLCYALMYDNKPLLNDPIEVGIISFKNMKAGFMPFGFGKGRGVVSQTTITKEILQQFKEELVVLIAEILNNQLSLKEKL